MRIAIDARALLHERTGIGTYTDAIARALAARPGISVGLFAPRPLPASVNDSGAFSLQTDHHPFGIVWLQSTLPRRIARWGADVLVSALTIGPARGETPFVSTVHDLTPADAPRVARRADPRRLPAPLGAHRRARGAVPLRLADHGDATSPTATRRPGPRVRVTLNGVDLAYFTPADDPAARRRTRQRYSAGQPFILYLGTLEPRKNVEALVVACERHVGPAALAAGPGARRRRRLEDGGPPPPHRPLPFPRQDPRRRATPPRDAARELYRAAEVFVYPSLAEGFGLPVLEAMACGTPVVASTADALVEVGGDAALYAPPRDVEALARAIERALEDVPLREKLASGGPGAGPAVSVGRRRPAATAEAVAEAAREGR